MPHPIQTLQFPSIATIPGFSHAITTREGGVSEAEYASLNLGFHVDDNPEAVCENRRRIARTLGYAPESLVAAQQVHGSEVAVVGVSDSGRGALDWDSALPAADSLIVAEPGIPALILVADCAPILIVHPETHIFAVVHAGWRGAVARIASNTVAAMAARFAISPEELKAGIGPHLCPACFEIGEEVAEAASAVSPASVIGGHEKPHLDLAALLEADLGEAGLLPHNKERLPNCPLCENDLFFSHRAQGGTAGRFALVAWRAS